MPPESSSIHRIDLASLGDALIRGATVLVPNHRIREAVLAEFTTSFKPTTFRTPQVIAIDIWIKKQWETLAIAGEQPFISYRIMSAAEELLLWTSIVENTRDLLPLLNPEETAALVSHSYLLMKQWIPATRAQLQLQANAGLVDISAFMAWVEQFQKQCEEKQLISLVDCTEKLVDTLDHSELLQNSTDILLLNFYQPPPLYQALFAKLPDARQIFTIAIESSDSRCATRRHEFIDSLSEIRACCNWAQALLAAQPNMHIGIICNSDDTEKRAIEAVFRDVLQPDALIELANETHLFNGNRAKERLDGAGFIHDALLLLGLMHEEQNSHNLSRLLQSPFIPADQDESEARGQMDLYMRRRLPATCSLQDFSYHLSRKDKSFHCPHLSDAITAMKTLLRGARSTASCADWSACFTAILDRFGWPGEVLSAAEQQVYTVWQEALATFAAASTALGSLDARSALACLQLICSQTYQRQRFDASRPLSLLSVQEAVGLQFDHVWLLSFDDQRWPQAASPSPFLPYSLQREFCLPGSHSDVQFQLCRELFALLLRSVSDSCIVSHHLTEGEQQFRGSSFTRHFPLTAIDLVSVSAINGYAAQLANRSSLVQVSDCPTFPVLDDESVQGGQSVISKQSSCPFRAFAHHRLHAEPLEEFATGLNSMARGSAMHVALESLFESVTSRAVLIALTEEQIAQQCRDSAALAVDYLARNYRSVMTPRFRAIEQQRICKLLRAFLSLETKREDFEIIAREISQQSRLEGLTLNLKIDRIDRLGDGSIAVMDYKTGKYTPTRQSWLEARPEDMQLPLYYTVTAEQQSAEVSAVTIAHINAGNIAYSGLAARNNFDSALKPIDEDAKLATTWSAVTEQWENQVRSLAREFIQGQAQVMPARGFHSCQYCGLQPLCRIQELTGKDAQLGADEEVP
ncbi:MAG: PD-(D/E)XK nuclease family protein [Proteobacteria bacterium]|nr:PD-(D/E)XK nuclease family protein [Pseudomonadota bacterium]